MPNYYPVRVTQVQIGANTSAAIMYVAEKVNTPQGGDFVIPRTVANTVAPVGVVHLHKWWEITVAIDEEDETLLFVADLISPNNASVTTLGEGATLNTTLVITQKNSAGATRTITYTTVYVKNWSNKITNDEDHQPVEVVFLSYGTRTVTAWT